MNDGEIGVGCFDDLEGSGVDVSKWDEVGVDWLGWVIGGEVYLGGGKIDSFRELDRGVRRGRRGGCLGVGSGGGGKGG